MQKYTILRKKEYFCTLFTLIHIAMSCILNIETSTNVCSVAVSKDGECIFNREDHGGPNHAVQLGVYVDEALKFADGNGASLDAVAVSCGPGSYTGLRIGVSMAKGICYGRNLHLIAVPTLELLAVPVLLGHGLEDEPGSGMAGRTLSMPVRTGIISTDILYISSETVHASAWRR